MESQPDRPSLEQDPKYQKLMRDLLEEEVAKRRQKETVVERILKSSIVGVIAGSLLTIVANEMTERRRARERAEDALQQRTQATLQVADNIATLVYDRRTQAELFAAMIPHEGTDFHGDIVDEFRNRKAAYDAARAAFSRDVPVQMLRLRNRIGSERLRRLSVYFRDGVEARADTISAMLVQLYHRTMSSRVPVSRTSLDADTELALDGYPECSNSVIDLLYSTITEDEARVSADEESIRAACRHDETSWRRLRERIGRR